jgi:hypothetical protein
MSRRPGRGAHRGIDDRRGRRVVTVLLALVAAGAAFAVVFGSVAGNRPEPVPLRVETTATADPAATRACEVTVARGRDAVAAAQPSYSHWAGHVRAQIDYDNKVATLEQTRTRWAATKATADADIAQFRRAFDAYDAVRDGCADRPGAVQPGDADPVMAVCRSDFAAVSAAVTAAKAVVDDWAAHVEMMKGKEHTDPQQYGQMWRDMVKAAPTDLGRFADASLELRKHVDCPRPS